MINLKPLPENEVTDDIRSVYADISLQMQSSAIPLLFQYLANYPDYLIYAWSKISATIQTPQFVQSEKQLTYLSDAMISVIYKTSPFMESFAKDLQTHELFNLQLTIAEIIRLNAVVVEWQTRRP